MESPDAHPGKVEWLLAGLRGVRFDLCLIATGRNKTRAKWYKIGQFVLRWHDHTARRHHQLDSSKNPLGSHYRG